MPRNAQEVKTFSANLLLAGRRCLLAGGGKIAARKLRGLLDAEAEVAVVAPEASPAVEELCKEGNAKLIRRGFQDSDIDGAFVVFAATDDAALNKHIVELCASKGALCCAIDSNWPSGSFITPASFESKGLKVAISTGGASCRKSRILKESLARHIEMLEGAEILIIGFDHNYLSLSQREPYHLIGDRLERAGAMLTCVWGLHEFMLLNTCNRMELIAVASPGEAVKSLILRALGLDGLQEDCYYVKRSWEAFTHLPSVAAGLMSQTPGEKHIVSQLTDFLECAKGYGWAGPLIQDWVDAALHISKHIRSETEPHYRNYEIEDLAMKFVEDQLKDLKGLRTIVIGSGQVGTAVVERLAKAGCEIDWLYHSKPPEHPEWAADNIRISSINLLKDKLQGARLLVSAASTQVPLVHHGHAPFIDHGQSVLMVDLGTPRNISPELPKLMANIKVRDMDDLKHWHRREFVDMSLLFDISSKTIGAHREMYDKILSGLQSGNSQEPSGPDAN